MNTSYLAIVEGDDQTKFLKEVNDWYDNETVEILDVQFRTNTVDHLIFYTAFIVLRDVTDS